MKKFQEYEENPKEVISTDGIISTMLDDLKDSCEMAKPKTEHLD